MYSPTRNDARSTRARDQSEEEGRGGGLYSPARKAKGAVQCRGLTGLLFPAARAIESRFDRRLFFFDHRVRWLELKSAYVARFRISAKQALALALALALKLYALRHTQQRASHAARAYRGHASSTCAMGHAGHLRSIRESASCSCSVASNSHSSGIGRPITPTSSLLYGRKNSCSSSLTSWVK